jgi:hypothetical protein
VGPNTALTTWIENMTPSMLNLMAVAASATDALSAGTPAMRSSADQIRATVAEGRRRFDADRGPDVEFGTRLERVHERFEFMARSLEADPEEFGGGYLPAVAHQLRQLIVDLTTFIADLERAMRGPGAR